MSKSTNPTKVITGKKCIFSYLTVNEPKEPLGGGAPRYSASILFPKTDTETYGKVQAAIEAAYKEGQTKLRGKDGKVPPLEDLKLPLHDGDKKGDPVYAGHWYFNANSRTKPGCVDADRNPILDSSELYSGIIGRASVNLYAFNSNGSKGIAVGLNNIQKLADGKPLGGHSRAEDDFDDGDDDDDSFLS